MPVIDLLDLDLDLLGLGDVVEGRDLFAYKGVAIAPSLADDGLQTEHGDVDDDKEDGDPGPFAPVVGFIAENEHDRDSAWGMRRLHGLNKHRSRKGKVADIQCAKRLAHWLFP